MIYEAVLLPKHYFEKHLITKYHLCTLRPIPTWSRERTNKTSGNLRKFVFNRTDKAGVAGNNPRRSYHRARAGHYRERCELVLDRGIPAGLERNYRSASCTICHRTASSRIRRDSWRAAGIMNALLVFSVRDGARQLDK